MSNEFPSPPEEVQRLARELELLRSDLQNALSKLSQMEKRLRAAFPTLPKPQRTDRPETPLPVSTRSRDELLHTFDDLVAMRRSGQDSDFESRIRALPPEDAIALAVELGAGRGKKTSLKTAIDGIRGRVNETILLSKTRQVSEKPAGPLGH